MLHSHPSRRDPSDDNDEFSWGDGLAALLAGQITLTTQDSTMFVLNQDEALEVVISGLKADIARLLKNSNLEKRDEIDWNSIIQSSQDFRRGRNFTTLPYHAFDARE